MHRNQKYADHARKRIEDPMDAHATNLCALKGDQIVGVVRINLPRDGGVEQYERFYEMERMKVDHPAHTSLVTRLMVLPELRHTSVVVRLFLACYRFGLQNDVRWCFVDCNDPLVGLFNGFGFVEYAPMAEHDEYGLVHRMRLDLHDEARFEAMNSPFAAELRRHLTPA